MSIVLIGGHDRMHQEYKILCGKKGHEIKVFTQMPKGLKKVIGKPDAIVIFTATCSHKMMEVAVKEAKRKGVNIIRNHSSSLAALSSIIGELESGHYDEG